jgi:hypothetical protein
VSASKRTYTFAQYQRDCAALAEIRRQDAPGLARLLAEAITADAELVGPAPNAPRRDTVPGGFVHPVTILATPAVLRAVGLTPRPSARGGAR